MHLRRNFSRLVFALLCGAVAPLPAAVFPLSENTWSNPEFVAKFTGSYGFDAEKTPSITTEEKKLFEQLATIIPTDPGQAVKVIEAALKPESSAALDYTLANLHFQAGRVEPAIQAYQASLKKFPAFARAQKNLGILYVQQGRHDDALAALLEATRGGGMDGSLLGLIGYAYLSKGRTASALDAYRLALVFEPESRDWRLGKAQCLVQIGEHKEAIAMLDEMIREQPAHTDLLLLQANAFVADEQPMAAAANLQIVRATGQARTDSLVLLGDILAGHSGSDVALPYYLEALERADLTPDRTLRILRVLLARDAWNEADAIIARVKTAMAGRFDDAGGLELLNFEAQVALAKNDDARAAEILESVVAKDPLNGRAILLLANYHAKKSDVERAELYYARAASVPATQVEALIQHARLLAGRREFSRASDLLARAQALRPQNHVAAYLAKVEAAAAAVR